MAIISAVKLVIIFPFIVYFLLYFLTRSEKQSFILVSPLYLLSLVLICRYIFGPILAIVVIAVILIGLLYITSEYSRQKKNSIVRFIRTFFVTTGRFYPMIYIGLVIIGIIQEYIKIR